MSLHVRIHPCSVGRLLYDLGCHGASRQPHDGKPLSCDLIGETLTNCSTILTGKLTSRTNTHIDPHVPIKGVVVTAHDLSRVHPAHTLSSGLQFSHGHFCFTVGYEVGLRRQVVLAVAVASAAVEWIWIQNGTLRPFGPVGLPPTHRLSPIPAF